MSTSIRRLGDEELPVAVEAIDPVAVLVRDLVGERVAGGERSCVLRRWPNETSAADLVLVSDTADSGLLMSEPSLRALHVAGLATLAARELLALGPVRAAVLGIGVVVQSLLTMIARRLPAVSRIVVYPATVDHGRAVWAHAIEQLDLTGVELSVTDDIGEAVAGAGLVIATGDTAGELGRDLIGRGVLVINAGSSDLPADLVDVADRVYVDDLALLARPGVRQVPNGTVDADLGQVISGARPGRSGSDDIVLAELLDAGVLHPGLACSLGRVARERGLGAERID